ncbi:MAG: hypothetical protein KGI57_04180 [Hyphomicrobiales bacterium]|nr:hypothetical protein [Hyphomicrobiales bacterium]
MSSVAAHPPIEGSRSRPWTRRAAAWAPVLACLAFALVFQALREANSDTPWLIDVCRRMLSGERLYVDVIETNPPASVLLYMAPTAFARALGVDAGFLVRMSVVAGVAASLALCAAILRRAPAAFREGPALLAAAAAATLVLPALSFDERDDIALYAGLPFLAVMAARAAGAASFPTASILAGIGAGAAVSIKPTYALMYLAPLPFALWRAGWRAALADLAPWTGAATFGLYVAAVGRYFPHYASDVLPALREAYLPWRRPLAGLVANGSTLFAGLALCVGALASRGRPRPATETVAALGALGATAAMIAQGKGWPYTGYAGAALAAISAGPALAAHWRLGARRFSLSLLALAALTFEGGFFWFDSNGATPPLAAAIRALGPHPTIMSLSTDISIGFPLATESGARWVGRENSFVIAMTARARLMADPNLPPDLAARLRGYEARDYSIAAQDIASRRPDAVLAGDADWKDGEWAAPMPAVERAMEDYAPAAHAGRAILFVRKPRLRGASR